MKDKLKDMCIIAGGVALVGVAAFFVWSDGDPVSEADAPRLVRANRIPETSAVKTQNRPPSGSLGQAGRHPTHSKEGASRGAQPALASVVEPELTPQDQKIADAIQDALDDDDFKHLVAQLERASSSKEPAVRLKAVEALQWFGEEALSELTPFLADPDADVRASAMGAVEQSLMGIDDDKRKISVIESLMKVKGLCSENGMTMLSGILNGVSDETLTAGMVTRVIRSKPDPEVVAAMKEVYEFATGEAYVDETTAEAWIKGKLNERMTEAEQGTTDGLNAETEHEDAVE